MKKSFKINIKILRIQKKEKHIHLKVEQYIQENGLTNKDMDLVSKLGLMELNMKVVGEIIKQKDKENSYMLMEIYLKESGLMIKLMDMVFIFIKTELNMKATGRTTYNMEKE